MIKKSDVVYVSLIFWAPWLIEGWREWIFAFLGLPFMPGAPAHQSRVGRFLELPGGGRLLLA